MIKYNLIVQDREDYVDLIANNRINDKQSFNELL